MNTLGKFALLAGCWMFAGVTLTLAQGDHRKQFCRVSHKSWPWTNVIR